MKKIILFLFIGCISFQSQSQTPDWSTGIATILYNNCTVCHHSGGIAPFSLLTYADAVDNGFLIQADVNSKKMPPWPPDPNFVHFRNERVLSEFELQSINDWVDGGMPSGDLSLAPAAPTYNGLSLMTQVDDTLHMPVYTVDVDTDVYRSFVVHSGYNEKKYLNEVEVIPGNYSMVHHIFLFHDSTDGSYQEDLNDPEPGFAGGGLGGQSEGTVLFLGWVPGSEIFKLPSNMAFVIPANADYVVEFHYAPGSNGKTDSTKINLKFTDAPDIRPIYNERWLYWHPPSLTDGPLTIHADQYRSFHEQSDTMTKDLSLIAIAPHNHHIGVSWKVVMVTAPGDTTNLISIPQWYFDWQLIYFFTKVIKVPIGAQVFGEAYFDNTSNNPDNPSNPPENVFQGEGTFNEMMSCRFWLMDYQEGDENIILDSAYYTSANNYFEPDALPLQVFPNPAKDVLHFMATLPEHEVTWSLQNVLGEIVSSGNELNVRKGMYAKEISIASLAAGNYLLTVSTGNQRASRKVEVMK